MPGSNLASKFSDEIEKSFARPAQEAQQIMKLNVGSVDRAVRLLLGAALIALFFVLSETLDYVFLCVLYI